MLFRQTLKIPLPAVIKSLTYFLNKRLMGISKNVKCQPNYNILSFKEPLIWTLKIFQRQDQKLGTSCEQRIYFNYMVGKIKLLKNAVNLCTLIKIKSLSKSAHPWKCSPHEGYSLPEAAGHHLSWSWPALASERGSRSLWLFTYFLRNYISA